MLDTKTAIQPGLKSCIVGVLLFNQLNINVDASYKEHTGTCRGFRGRYFTLHRSLDAEQAGSLIMKEVVTRVKEMKLTSVHFETNNLAAAKSINDAFPAIFK
ncbi:hypothetical protein C5167_027149 [Papaver somniferum]|nr:hypothetical protein C5167_027149 [Papaver somniferum]